MTSSIAKAINYVVSKIGAPYIWGGKGKYIWTPDGLHPHPWPGDVFDCCGIASCALYFVSGVDTRETHNVSTMWIKWQRITAPIPGALAVYGADAAPSHVMVHINDSVVVGASGGTSACVSMEARGKYMAETGRDASVRSFYTHLYRKDFLGWVMPPY